MAALAAAVARLIAGRSAPPILASLLGFAAVYGGTFLSETRDALKPAADQGTFDPAGWSMTLLALTVAVVVTGWAASVLAGIVRSQLVISWGDLHDLARSRSRRSAKVARPMAVLAVVALLALTGPVLGDMLNFGPQIHMRQTSSMPVGLFGGAPSTAGDLPSTMPGDSGLSIGVSAGATDRARPWEAWRPTGSATLTSVVFPAPWVGGTATTLKASIYLPPGYATGSQRYPVLYEVPWSLYLWEGGLGFPAPMDSLIDSGLVPAQIVVFISEGGGPYPDSECADSFDGREHYESFLVHTVVPYVDATYRTISAGVARRLPGRFLRAEPPVPEPRYVRAGRLVQWLLHSRGREPADDQRLAAVWRKQRAGRGQFPGPRGHAPTGGRPEPSVPGRVGLAVGRFLRPPDSRFRGSAPAGRNSGRSPP